jgi:hypothetical protein
MFVYIQESGIVVWILGIVTYFILNFFTKGIQVSFLDSLGFLNINIAFATTTLFSLYSLGMIDWSETVNTVLITIAFYLGIYITARYHGRRIRSYVENNHLERIVQTDRLLSNNLVILGLISIGLSVFFAFLLLSSGDISDDRIIIAKSLKGPDLIKHGTSLLFIYVAILSLLVRKNKISIVFLVLSIGTAFFSGSKGFIIPYSIAYFTLTNLLFPDRKQTFKTIAIVFTIIASSSFVKVFWGSNIVEAFFEIINRLFSSGDTYYYAFYLTDVSKLFDDYNFFSYLLHPFTSLFFIKGYDYPIGTNLFGKVTGDYSGYGPNATLSIVLMVLLKGNIFFTTLISFLFGVFVCKLRIWGLRALFGYSSTPPFWRLAIFIVCFVLPPDLFVDIGLFEQACISVFAVVFALSIFYEISGLSYGVKRKQHG